MQNLEDLQNTSVAKRTLLPQFWTSPSGVVSNRTMTNSKCYWAVEPCVITSVSNTNSNPALFGRTVETAIETASSSEIERALKLYYVPDRVAVRSFLEANQFLVSLLIDAKFAIEKHFPNAVLRLVVVQDMEIKDRKILNVAIHTDGSYSDNKASSRNLDRGWWFRAMPRGRGKLSIDIS